MSDSYSKEDAISQLHRLCSINRDWYYQYMAVNLPRIQGDADFIAKYISCNSSVLDIGAVPPLLIELLRRRGFRKCSIADPHPEPFTEYFAEMLFSAHKIDIIKSTPDALREEFDLVCLNEVVEHLSGNLLVAIKNAADCVRSGGYLLVTTPNLRSIWGLYSLLFRSSGLASKPGASIREQYERASAQFGYFGHLREYTEFEIIALFESFNFSFYASEFQSNYIDFGKPTKYINFAERFLPKWRLFGKYLFKKNTV